MDRRVFGSLCNCVVFCMDCLYNTYCIVLPKGLSLKTNEISQVSFLMKMKRGSKVARKFSFLPIPAVASLGKVFFGLS